MDDYLAKPVDGSALEAALARWVPDRAGQPVPGPPGKPAPDSVPGSAPVPTPQPLAVTGAAPDAALWTVPALDPERLAILQSLDGGGLGVLRPAVAAFRKDLPARLSALRAAADGDDGPALAEAAHTLKGSAANIGAVAVAAVCAELERLGHAGMHDGGPALMSRLASELRRLEPELDKVVEVTG